LAFPAHMFFVDNEIRASPIARRQRNRQQLTIFGDAGTEVPAFWLYLIRCKSASAAMKPKAFQPAPETMVFKT
jgi:hypothetical protein